MLTVVLIGNSQSYWSGEKLVTPRGYKRGEEARARGGEEARAPGGEEAGTHPTYPINLSQMHEAPVIVVGGGLVGERKVRGLLAVGAQVMLLSPDATPHLRAWAADGRIVWEQRPYQPGDLAARPRLVFAATSERAVNAQIAQEAAALGLLCNVADAPHEGAFHLPAVHREDGLVVAISTEGASPGRARRLRERLSELLQQEEARDEG
jgi:cobalt-precorrin 5A hydrolase/precorrin-3B C17-methyltransferase